MERNINGINYEFNSDELTAAVCKTKVAGDVVIPSMVRYDWVDYRVTSIGYYAFKGCSSLSSVVIPDSVTSIWWGAFDGCSSLSSVVIPAGVTSIWWGACLSVCLRTMWVSLSVVLMYLNAACSCGVGDDVTLLYFGRPVLLYILMVGVI